MAHVKRTRSEDDGFRGGRSVVEAGSMRVDAPRRRAGGGRAPLSINPLAPGGWSDNPTAVAEKIVFRLWADGMLSGRAIEQARRDLDGRGRLDQMLVQLGVVDEEAAALALFAELEIATADEEDFPEAPVAGLDIPGRFVRETLALPIDDDGETLTLVMADPLDDYALRAIAMKARRRLSVLGAPPRVVRAHAARLYDDAGSTREAPRLPDLSRRPPALPAPRRQDGPALLPAPRRRVSGPAREEWGAAEAAREERGAAEAASPPAAAQADRNRRPDQRFEARGEAADAPGRSALSRSSQPRPIPGREIATLEPGLRRRAGRPSDLRPTSASFSGRDELDRATAIERARDAMGLRRRATPDVDVSAEPDEGAPRPSFVRPRKKTLRSRVDSAAARARAQGDAAWSDDMFDPIEVYGEDAVEHRRRFVGGFVGGFIGAPSRRVDMEDDIEAARDADGRPQRDRSATVASAALSAAVRAAAHDAAKVQAAVADAEEETAAALAEAARTARVDAQAARTEARRDLPVSARPEIAPSVEAQLDAIGAMLRARRATASDADRSADAADAERMRRDAIAGVAAAAQLRQTGPATDDGPTGATPRWSVRPPATGAAADANALRHAVKVTRRDLRLAQRRTRHQTARERMLAELRRSLHGEDTKADGRVAPSVLYDARLDASVATPLDGDAAPASREPSPSRRAREHGSARGTLRGPRARVGDDGASGPISRHRLASEPTETPAARPASAPMMSQTASPSTEVERAAADLLERAVRGGEGLIVLVGPAGSGKMATLRRLAATVAGGAHVAERFAATPGLRSIEDEAPVAGRIAIGEIRDAESAEAAARLAMGGGLALASLDVPHIAAAAPRLTMMGLPPYALASSLRAIVAQKLGPNSSPSLIDAVEPDDTLRALILAGAPEAAFRHAVAAMETEAARAASSAGREGATRSSRVTRESGPDAGPGASPRRAAGAPWTR